MIEDTNENNFGAFINGQITYSLNHKINGEIVKWIVKHLYTASKDQKLTK